MFQPGARLAGYRMISLLGRGGMGEVWRALKEGPSGFEWSRQVALKIILPRFAREDEFRELFVSEARIAAGMAHPNIVSVTDFGTTGDMLFLEQELIDGVNGGRIIEHSPTGVPLPLALFIACEALKALGYAHQHESADGQMRRVIHRDIKPGNLLVGREGQVKLTDFGIAKVVRDDPSLTQVKGTIGYIAPEILEGAQPSETSDLFGIGLVLYELITGKKLFGGAEEAARLFRTYECQVPPVQEWGAPVPPAVEAIVRRMLARDPAARFPNAASVVEAIRSTPIGREATSVELKAHLLAIGVKPPSMTIPPLPSLALPSRTATLAGEVRGPTRSRKGRRTLFGLLAAAAVGGGALAVFQFRDAGPRAAALVPQPEPRPVPTAAPAPAAVPDAAAPVRRPDARTIPDAAPVAQPAPAAQPEPIAEPAPVAESKPPLPEKIPSNLPPPPAIQKKVKRLQPSRPAGPEAPKPKPDTERNEIFRPE